MTTILTIDDDKITHRFVEKALQSEFDLVNAYDGEELQQKVPHMGLNEDQEEYILGRVDRSILEVTDKNSQGDLIFDAIRSVLANLDVLAASQKSISESLDKSSEAWSDDTDNHTIELF